LDENDCPDVHFVPSSDLIVRTTSSARFYPLDAVLPIDGFLPRLRAVKLHSHGRVPMSVRMWGPPVRTRECVCTDMKKKKIKKYFIFSCPHGCWSRPHGHGKKKRKNYFNYFIYFLASMQTHLYTSVFAWGLEMRMGG
jgi:hypothetical protein